MKYEIIAVDFQNDFGTEGGRYFTPKPSVEFLQQKLMPFFKENHLKINEIISDYRPPRPGDRGDCCHPGEWGYQSIIPSEFVKSTWIKCMNSPIWVRENIGRKKQKPGLPYQDPEGFVDWLEKNIGKPNEIKPVLIGLTIDCCVLSTLQELSWQGYYPMVLREGVDHASGKITDRDQTLSNPVPNWGEVINWDKLQKLLKGVEMGGKGRKG